MAPTGTDGLLACLDRDWCGEHWNDQRVFWRAPGTTTAADGGPAFAFPLHILINSRPALLCTVTAAEPVTPIRVCGGFTRLVACDPEDNERRVVLTLLAARAAARPAPPP